MLKTTPTYAYDTPKNMGGIIMERLSHWRQGDRWVVGYWDGEKQIKITRYKRMVMRHESYAIQLKGEIHAEWERHKDGYCAFHIERWTGKLYTDVLEFCEDWMVNVIIPKRKPGTIAVYKSYFKLWIRPFFEQNPVMLHEIQLNTLNKLMNSIKLSGRSKLQIMSMFRGMMDYAWRSRRIPEMPPFPKKKDYNIIDRPIRWLSEDRQMAVINAIPEVHRQIFLFLKYHLRRPGEACALKWRDYDEINRIFTIRRSISAGRLVESTKTGAEHIIPCHGHFHKTINAIRHGFGDRFDEFIFKNNRAIRQDKRYSSDSLNRIWRNACKKAGESIDLYSGLKHSSCSQYVNEKGLSLSELQMITDHKKLESVRRYADVKVARKRELMERVSTTTYHNLKLVEK